MFSPNMTKLLRFAVVVGAASLLAACGGPGAPSRPPSAQDVLSKPVHAGSLKDAHFLRDRQIRHQRCDRRRHRRRRAALQIAHGRPLQVSGSHGRRTAGQLRGYLDPTGRTTRTDRSWQWQVGCQSEHSRLGPSSFTGTFAFTYVGEESLAGGKAWHASANDKDGNPFDAWIRESDGYPPEVRDHAAGQFPHPHLRQVQHRSHDRRASGLAGGEGLQVQPRRTLLVLAVAVLTAGCGVPTPAPPPSAKDVLAKPPAIEPDGRPLRGDGQDYEQRRDRPIGWRRRVSLQAEARGTIQIHDDRRRPGADDRGDLGGRHQLRPHSCVQPNGRRKRAPRAGSIPTRSRARANRKYIKARRRCPRARSGTPPPRTGMAMPSTPTSVRVTGYLDQVHRDPDRRSEHHPGPSTTTTPARPSTPPPANQIQ